MATESILVIDDDDSLRKVIEFTLRQEGYQVRACPDGMEGLREFRRTRPDVVITDVQLGDMSGYDVLRTVRTERPEVMVIVMTAYGTIEKAVEAMKLGAYEYLVKPFSCDQLKILTTKAVRSKDLPGRSLASRKPEAEDILVPIIGQSEMMQTIMTMSRKVAASEATVLILGESGTGKELIARAVHNASPRAQGRYCKINYTSALNKMQ
jgi:two-component system NtrC family response regulator